MSGRRAAAGISDRGGGASWLSWSVADHPRRGRVRAGRFRSQGPQPADGVPDPDPFPDGSVWAAERADVFDELEGRQLTVTNRVFADQSYDPAPGWARWAGGRTWSQCGEFCGAGGAHRVEPIRPRLRFPLRSARGRHRRQTFSKPFETVATGRLLDHGDAVAMVLPPVSPRDAARDPRFGHRAISPRPVLAGTGTSAARRTAARGAVFMTLRSAVGRYLPLPRS